MPLKTIALLFALILATAPIPAQSGWTPIASGTTADLHDVVLVGQYAVAVGDAGTILRSTDGGLSWTAAPSGTSADLVSVNLGGSRFSASGTGGTVVVSFDAGATWIDRSITTGATLEVFSAASDVIWAASDDGTLYLSQNNGLDWEVRYDDPRFSWRGGEASTQNSPGCVVGDQGAILTASDGSDWHNVASGVSADLKGLIGPYGWAIIVGERGTILKSTDLGNTWSPRNSGTGADLEAAARGYGDFAVGAHGTILKSTDAGETWCPLQSGTAARLNGISGSDLTLLAVGAGGTILRTSDGGGWCADPTAAPEAAWSAPSPLDLAVAPNPARARTQVVVRGQVSGSIEVNLVDASGRLLRRALRGGGTHGGPDTQGTRGGRVDLSAPVFNLDLGGVPSGSYWIVARDAAGVASQRVAVVK